MAFYVNRMVIHLAKMPATFCFAIGRFRYGNAPRAGIEKNGCRYGDDTKQYCLFHEKWFTYLKLVSEKVEVILPADIELDSKNTGF